MNEATRQRLSERLTTQPACRVDELASLYFAGEDESTSVQRFLDVAAPMDLRAERAGLIVRCLHQDVDILEADGVGQRKRVLEFVDEALGSFYKGWRVSTDGPDFQRLAALSSLIPQAENAVTAALSQLVSLSTLDSARSDVQRALSANRALFAPLVPGPLLKAKVGELFDAAKLVGATEGGEFLAAHARADELLSQFRREVEDAGPVATQLLAPLVTRLEQLCTDAYTSSSATEPANLSAAAVPKKYPFGGAPDDQFRLAVAITNHGPGQALDARLDDLEADGVALAATTVPLGQVTPGTIGATVPAAATIPPSDAAILGGQLRWRDSNGLDRSEPFEATFEAQRTDIPWDSIKQRYDLDPVRSTDDLLGRAEVLRDLQDLVGERRVGSAFITGQKRVGKTSIALTFQSLLSEDPDVAVVYLEAGTFVQPSAARTATAMGEAIAQELVQVGPKFADIAIPQFEQTLAPLRSLVGQMRARAPKLRVVIVIDEFDELPLEMYRRGPIGDAFFLALRSLASQDHIGFLLVGGEKMGPIIDAQGDQLNKFEAVTVTYLDRERHWEDFADLVRVPVSDCFEITDAAVVALFELTAGHPYFTKLVCRALFKLAVLRRDAHLTEAEIKHAADDALAGASTTNFIHFWEDGVLEAGEKTEDVSVRRRKLLLAYAESSEADDRNVDGVLHRAESYGLVGHQARDLVREFGRRGVLEESRGELRAKVKLFDLWLTRYGVRAITTTFTDPDAILHAKRREQEDRVQPEEITELVAGWGIYRGKAVTAEDVRQWLNQFDSVRDQRLMFTVLRAVRFYDSSRIRAKLREADGVVRRGVTRRLEAGKLKRDELVVSYLGEVGKSGARYARLFADENSVYADQVKEPRDLPEALAAEPVQVLVLVDDMLGSGDQATQFLEELETRLGGVIRKRGIRVVLVVLAGFADAERRVVETAERLELPVHVHLCDPLGESDRCFSADAPVFGSEAEREEARGLAESYGRRLQRKAPLGYGDVQATIVFDESCPNGTLPILWDRKDGWKALFPRHKGR